MDWSQRKHWVDPDQQAASLSCVCYRPIWNEEVGNIGITYKHWLYCTWWSLWSRPRPCSASWWGSSWWPPRWGPPRAGRSRGWSPPCCRCSQWAPSPPPGSGWSCQNGATDPETILINRIKNRNEKVVVLKQFFFDWHIFLVFNSSSCISDNQWHFMEQVRFYV